MRVLITLRERPSDGAVLEHGDFVDQSDTRRRSPREDEHHEADNHFGRWAQGWLRYACNRAESLRVASAATSGCSR
jgi:hypothetical protein